MLLNSSSYRLALVSAVVSALSVSLFVTPSAHAVADETNSSAFESAQEAVGLSPDDARRLAPGLSVSTEEDTASIALGNFEVTIAAPSDKPADTTVLPDGARLMSMLADGESSARFTLDLPGGVSPAENAGGYDLVGSADGTRVLLGHIAKPWAVDAADKRLPTSYRVDGNDLIQDVDTSGASYPIIVDPAVSVGWGADGPGVYWNMYGYQAKALVAATSTSVSLLWAGRCAAAVKIPRVGAVIGFVCTFIGAPKLAQVLSNIQWIMNRSPLDNLTCYQLKVPDNRGFRIASRSNCA